MTRAEHLVYCKVCTHRSMSTDKGLVCGITNEIANFDTQCNHFTQDTEKEAPVTADVANKRFNHKQSMHKGRQWFLTIFGLSVINSVIFFSKGTVSFVFGLGITRYFEVLYIQLFEVFDVVGLVCSILFSSIFFVVYVLNRTFNKPAFIFGMVFYGVDTLLVLGLSDWLGVAVHVYVLFMLFKIYKALVGKQETMQEDSVV